MGDPVIRCFTLKPGIAHGFVYLHVVGPQMKFTSIVLASGVDERTWEQELPQAPNFRDSRGIPVGVV